VLKALESRLGPDHPSTLTGRNNLALAYLATGRADDAVRLHEGVLKALESRLGPDHPNTLSSRNNLAGAYHAAGRTADAVPLLEEVLKARESRLGADHPQTLASRDNLARVYQSLGRWAESEAVLRACLAIREKATPDGWARFDTMSMLGGALLGQRRYAEAEPLVVPGYEGMKAREGRIPPPSRRYLAEAALQVVRLYERWGKTEQAAAWKDRLGLADLPADVFARP
jgi:tetratricopeptide (TPR) repeat protein